MSDKLAAFPTIPIAGDCTADELVWFLDRAPASVRIRFFKRIAEHEHGDWGTAATKLLASFGSDQIDEASKEPTLWPAPSHGKKRQANERRSPAPTAARPSTGYCSVRSAGFAVGSVSDGPSPPKPSEQKAERTSDF